MSAAAIKTLSGEISTAIAAADYGSALTKIRQAWALIATTPIQMERESLRVQWGTQLEQLEKQCKQWLVEAAAGGLTATGRIRQTKIQRNSIFGDTDYT